jgi:hypothetical protein
MYGNKYRPVMKGEILHRRKCKPPSKNGGRLLFHPETGKEIIRGLEETDYLSTLNGLGLLTFNNPKL